MIVGLGLTAWPRRVCAGAPHKAPKALTPVKSLPTPILDKPKHLCYDGSLMDAWPNFHVSVRLRSLTQEELKRAIFLDVLLGAFMDDTPQNPWQRVKDDMLDQATEDDGDAFPPRA